MKDMLQTLAEIRDLATVRKGYDRRRTRDLADRALNKDELRVSGAIAHVERPKGHDAKLVIEVESHGRVVARPALTLRKLNAALDDPFRRQLLDVKPRMEKMRRGEYVARLRKKGRRTVLEVVPKGMKLAIIEIEIRDLWEWVEMFYAFYVTKKTGLQRGDLVLEKLIEGGRRCIRLVKP